MPTSGASTGKLANAFFPPHNSSTAADAGHSVPTHAMSGYAQRANLADYLNEAILNRLLANHHVRLVVQKLRGQVQTIFPNDRVHVYAEFLRYWGQTPFMCGRVKLRWLSRQLHLIYAKLYRIHRVW